MAKNYRASLRKSGASGKKIALIFQSARTPALRHNEGAPLSTSSQPCNSTALAPRTFVPVHDLPSQSFRSNGGCCPTVLRRFGHFLALTVPSAVGFAPCSFYAAPWRILAFTTRSHTTSQNSNYAILPNYGRILSQSIVLCERIRKPSIHAGLRTFIFKIAGSGNAY